jgi:hypothetical protein
MFYMLVHGMRHVLYIVFCNHFIALLCTCLVFHVAVVTPTYQHWYVRSRGRAPNISTDAAREHILINKFVAVLVRMSTGATHMMVYASPVIEDFLAVKIYQYLVGAGPGYSPTEKHGFYSLVKFLCRRKIVSRMDGINCAEWLCTHKIVNRIVGLMLLCTPVDERLEIPEWCSDCDGVRADGPERCCDSRLRLSTPYQQIAWQGGSASSFVWQK